MSIKALFQRFKNYYQIRIRTRLDALLIKTGKALNLNMLKQWCSVVTSQCKKITLQIRPIFLLLARKIKIFFAFFLKPLFIIQIYITGAFTFIKNHLLYFTKKYWEKFKQIKIRKQRIGEYIDQQTAKIKRLAWVQNFLDASQYDTRKPTLVSTCFANILALVFPLALMQVYDRIVPNRTLSTLTFLAIGVIFTFFIEGLLRVMRAYINLWADTKYEFSLEKSAFSKIMNAPMYVAEKTDVGTRLKQFNMLDQLKGFYNTQLLTSAYEIPFLLIFLFAIAFLGGWLFLIPLLAAVLTGYITLRFSKNWETLLEEKLTFEAKESDFIINVLTGIHTAKSIGMEELLIRRHERLQESGTAINYLSSVHDGDLITIKTISSQAIITLTATFGSMLVIHGDLAIGGLAACILLSGRVMQPLDRILTALNCLSMINIMRKKLDTIFTLPSETVGENSQLIISTGEITLKNISFEYSDKPESKILEDINLTIPANGLVGIIGENQSEKTALLNILSVVAKPSAGEYCVDGENIERYNMGMLHKKIAYLNRVGKLFRGTIMDNLSAFDEQLIPTARRLVDRLGLNAILSKLPNGYDTFVGEKAVEALPGGVMNLIFIIRALVNKPKIVLFDEANINLDTHYTQSMVDLLVYLKEQASVIVFARKQSTIALMDVVYTLKNKNITRVEHAE